MVSYYFFFFFLKEIGCILDALSTLIVVLRFSYFAWIQITIYQLLTSNYPQHKAASPSEPPN